MVNIFKYSWIGLIAFFILAAGAWGETQSEEQPAGKVTIKPVLKDKPQKASLKPIMKGDAAATPAPSPTQVPATPDTEPTQHPTPIKIKPIKTGEPAAQAVEKEATPDEVAVKPTPTEAVTQTATPAPAKPMQVRVRRRPKRNPAGELANSATPATPVPTPAVAAAPQQPAAPAQAAQAAQAVQAAQTTPKEPTQPATETAKAPAKNSDVKSVAVNEAFRTLMEAPPTAEAVADLSRLVNENPNHPLAAPALLRAGEICIQLKLADKAVIAYKNASLAARDSKTRKQAGEGLALAAASEGDFKQAAMRLTELRKNLAEAAADPGVIKSEGMALAAAADYNGAGALLQQVDQAALNDQSAPAKAQALLGQALVAELQGRQGQARQALTRVIQEHAGTVEAALARKRLADLESPLTP